MHAIITFTKEDFLTNYLFVVSKSKAITRMRRRGVFVLSGWLLLMAIVFYFLEDLTWMWYCIAASCAAFILFPQLQKLVYKKQYKKFVLEKFGKLQDVPFDITLTADKFIYKNIFSDVSLNTSQIENISETADYFFVKFHSQDTITLPKRSFDYNELNSLLTDIAQANNVSINRELEWKWK
ncbi:YcxB family protein [Mucilaginibacter terrae]|uniref:YcxB-like C-terminal domain-containing protein n=1 Tax=Mucilaginibacter terrae TaxID=1955052 RepID=A0ABU3GSF7_9SPHI|nr:YcxB family protein [Mucilaginibacter terrae]MDT3402698.1 hypothetical protein [Mucilaginibacter terrae]